MIKLTQRTCISVLIITVCIAGRAYPQQLAAVGGRSDNSRRGDNISLDAYLEKLENEFSVSFGYVDELLADKRIGAGIKVDETLEKSLARVLIPLGLYYKQIEGGFYVITARQKAQGSTSKHRSMREDKLKNLFISHRLSPLLIKPGLKQQTISGVVTSEDDNMPVPGANVLVKGTKTGALTDMDGTYRIQARATDTLIFSFLGYSALEIPVNGRTTINAALVTDVSKLDEVVVVGYGTVKKKDLTGAVSSVDNTRYETLPNVNITQALRGTVPGVSIGAGGNAGSGNSVTMRGQNSLNGGNSALIVVDGIIYNGQLGNLNPNDIASIDILRDASSTAIFGARAANGVVLITTKRGSTEKPTIQFNSYAGVQDLLMTQDLETPEQYVRKKLDYQRTLAFRGVAPEPDVSNPVQYLNLDEIANYRNNITKEPLDMISQTAPIQSYNLSIGAKTGKSNYYIAGSWSDQKGKVIGDRFQRGAIRVNLETKVTDWLKFGTNSSFSFVDVSGSQASLTDAYRLSPYARWYLDSAHTVLNPIPMTDGLIGNPLMPTLNKITDQRKNLFGIFYGEVAMPFIEGLTYRFTYSHNIISSKDYRFVPSFNAGGLNRVANVNNSVSEQQDMFLENLVKYNRTFADQHNVDVTLLYSYNLAKNSGLSADANTFPSEVLTWYSLSLGENQATNASFSDYHAIAMMARLNYKYKDRYLLTLTGRRDGASIFSANNKFAFFPSMALGWVISEENFMKGNDLIDFMKLRFSYGANGNQAINRYQSLSRIAAAEGYNYLFDGETAFGIAKTSMGNPELKWESTYAFNVGLDFELNSGRISGSVNYYDSDTKDLLMERTIPILNGFGSILSNLGAVNNKGIELELNTINIAGKDLEWTTGFNLAHNKNKIVRLYGQLDENGIEADDIANRWFIGKSIGAWYNYQTDGVWQIGEDIPDGFRAGDYKLRDLDNDGLITPEDRTILGYNVPDLMFGFNTTLRYKGFSLYAQVSGAIGGQRSNAGILDPSSSFTYRVRDQYINWWTPANPSNQYPSMDYQDSYALDWLQSTSYVRIQDVSLSYNFAKPVLDRLKLNQLQVYVSAKNPFLFTGWGGWDPETTGSGKGQYPTMRSLIMGINLNL